MLCTTRVQKAVREVEKLLVNQTNNKTQFSNMAKTSHADKKQNENIVLEPSIKVVKYVKQTDEEMAGRIQFLTDEVCAMRKERKRKEREIYYKTEEKVVIPEPIEEMVLRVELLRLRSAYRMRMKRRRGKSE